MSETHDTSSPTGTTTTGAARDDDDNTFVVRNPANQQGVGRIVPTTLCTINDVLRKAGIAQREWWQGTTIVQRQRIFRKYQQLLNDRADELAKWIVWENGKTITDAYGDIQRGMEVVECYSATNAVVATGQSSLMGINSSNTMDCHSYREPLDGICVGITPFNFPAMIPLWMFPIAIALGNAFVLKPSPQTPSASLLLAQLVREAGLPANLLQVVHGHADTALHLCRHDDVAAISFVGGNTAGQVIYEAAATATVGKRVQANLGAKNHAIIMPDAVQHRSAVVEAVVGAAFGAAGQRCMANSVVILVEQQQQQKTPTDSVNNNDNATATITTADWLNDICSRASQLTVGNGWDDGVDVGPVITQQAHDRICDIIDTSVQQGGTILLDGRRRPERRKKNTKDTNDDDDDAIKKEKEANQNDEGNFLRPTVLLLHSTDNIAYTEEIFGPVLVILCVSSLKEAVEIVNANRYGNGGSIFTTLGSTARTFARDVRVGQVGINTPIPVPIPLFSFTGNRASFRGDLNFYGGSGIHFYTQLKTVTSHWPNHNDSTNINSHNDNGATATNLGGVTMPTHGTS